MASLLLLLTVPVVLLTRYWLIQNAKVQTAARLAQAQKVTISAIDFWLRDQFLFATKTASNPEASQIVRLLAAVEIHDDTALQRPSSQQNEIRSLLGKLLTSPGSEYAVIDSHGSINVATEPQFESSAIPITKHCRGVLKKGLPALSRPFRLSVSIDSSDIDSDFRMAIVAPLQNSFDDVGAIARVIKVDDYFGKLLSQSRFGISGESYAIDRQGTLLTRSRFESELVETGRLADGESSVLKISAIVPESPASSKPTSEQTTQPLTRLADSLTRGGFGDDVDGYRNYMGTDVVGSWKWLDRYDLGIATEMSMDEAYGSIDQLTKFALVGLLISLCSSLSVAAFARLWRTPKDLPEQSQTQTGNRSLGQYELKQRIGRGGMGTVFLGSHRWLDRPVAIKVLENADATERSLARFQREVRLSAKLLHPNTIEIYDFGRTDEGTFYYVMEYVDGISLEQLVDYYDRQPSDRVIYLLVQICGSIAEAHEAGLVHRDIKPANVLLTSRSGIHDLVKVVDFGLAKQLDHETAQLTRTDSLTGTPLYMAPESIRDAASAGVLSDIYSIGAVGYTLLCGSPPFIGESSDVCVQKLYHEVESPAFRIGRTVSDDLQAVLLRCLRRDPKERPQSAKELAAMLLSCADSPHWTQADAGIWWREIFDGPYLEDFEAILQSETSDNTRGNTAINATRPPNIAPGASTAS
ncbi:serine/threonine protein kinase [Stieleria sp. JC731]|uniref:serine/threonine-protein kinase n=1 Tax=Pirellulaceae TaxID=2691357 RepID=UPI001E36FF90|nr:serine/threonine-protein kinase [Stieleria sp. JC731]MCC9603048.1 serine/threonine protein kinase [Stieleria sp. JC731]